MTLLTPKTLPELAAEAGENGFAIGSPVGFSDAESRLVGNAFDVDGAQTLRHFIKFEYFQALLQNRALRLRPLNGFDDDPAEGTLSDANAAGASHMGSQLAQQWGTNPETDGWKHFINGTLRRLTYVHCWFGQEEEDQAMWERYGDGGRGVCLKTTVRRLGESIKMPLLLRPEVCKVTYLDESVPIPTVIPSLASCRKRPKFAYEKEFRLKMELGSQECPQGASGELLPPGHQMVPVDLDRLIERVVPGPNTNDEFVEKLEAAVKAAGLNRLVCKSQLPPWNSQPQ